MRHVDLKMSHFLVLMLLLVFLGQVAQAEPTKISFMFRGGTLQSEVVKTWKAEFEKKNPDIVIEWQEAGGDDFMEKIPVWVATGVGPDVWEMWGNAARSMGDNGVTLDLTPYVKRDLTDRDIKDFFPVSWESGEINFGPRKGERFGMPSNGNVFVLNYNKDKFAQAGVPFPPVLDNQGVWNWDNFVNIGKKLTKSDGSKIIQWALDSDCLLYPVGRGAGWVQAAGGQYFNMPDHPTEFLGNKPEAVTALQYLQDLIWKHQIITPIDARAQADFKKGFSAMTVAMGTASLTDSDKNLSFDWDQGPRPMGAKSRGYYISADMFGVSSATKNKEASWRFVKFLTSTEGQNIYAKIMGRSPTRRTSFPLFQSLFPKRSTTYTMYGMLDSVISPAISMTEDARNLIQNAVRQQIATNKKSAQVAMDEIAEAMKALQKN